MTLEHIALNVPDPKATAAWYAEHLDMRIVKSVDSAPYIHFVADASGSMLELYHNPDGAIPDYASMSPYTLHLAFSVDDIGEERNRLVAAGASVAHGEEKTPSGDTLQFLRDPWGVCIQIVKRAKPML